MEKLKESPQQAHTSAFTQEIAATVAKSYGFNALRSQELQKI